MDDKAVLLKTLKNLVNDDFISASISGKRNKSCELNRIKLRMIKEKDKYVIQATKYVGNKVLHENMSVNDAVEYLKNNLESNFKQCQLETAEQICTMLMGKKGNVSIKIKNKKINNIQNINLTHDKLKNYLLPEGKPVDFLVELGVMNSEGYVIKAKYDKFRQINRFLEFIEDVAENLPLGRSANIIDFGCGKSYLTFAMYYYLKEKKGMNVNITGLDLKEDVIKKCNLLAMKLGYSNLTFLNGDIANYENTDAVDMVVTLHACDTATDYALAKAVKWNAKIIMSVPCCQHELNRQIKNELMQPILKYGLLKERMSALITDGIRAELLEKYGYDTQILEFIDMEHTPKNIMIRGIRKNPSIKPKQEREFYTVGLEKMIDELHVIPTLKTLLEDC